ncbi:DsbA family oxidoreductase [Streptomyces sp. NRRL F-7442]|uniref:DsbA family oxidoreductase n=1 Tax=Streptomyces sp. NRRL F-7442 TaxID=1519498 RepID=UPI00099C20AC|nr:DsbA family protein [Streptomyces sp. NRRL F-7442]
MTAVPDGPLAGTPGTTEVVEYTDPLCPWAWGSEPVFRWLRAALPAGVRRRRVFCVLFDEDDDPAPDPAAETAWYARYVEDVARHTGAPRAPRLHRVAASSWPASLVAKAAEAQGSDVAERVLRRLRETVFVLGVPADTHELALAAVRGVPGLDPARLAADALSDAVRERVRADRSEARRPVPGARSVPGGSPHPGAAKETGDGGYRYALPTVLVRAPGGHRLVPGLRPREAYAAAVGEMCAGVPLAAVRLSPDEALLRHRSLTGPEWVLLTDGGEPPSWAVRVETGNGPLWLHPEEAATHPATRSGSTAGR